MTFPYFPSGYRLCMGRRRRFGTRTAAAVGLMTAIALVATGCSGGLDDSTSARPISVKPNEGPVVAGASEFLVATGEPGRPTHLVKVGADGQVDWPADGGMIAGTQLSDGSWFILNSSCQGTSGVCGGVGGIGLSVDGEVKGSGDLWDDPGTYEVVGSSGSLVLVSVRTDTEVTAYWVDARTIKEAGQAFRSAPYDNAALRDAAEASQGGEEFDSPRSRFCAGDDAAFVLSSPEHRGVLEPPSRTVEVIPTPAAKRQGEAPRLFEVDIDGFDARLAGALMCGAGILTDITVGPSRDGGSEVTVSRLDVGTGDATQRSVATYETPLVELYGGGANRALLGVAQLGDLSDDDAGDVTSEGSATSVVSGTTSPSRGSAPADTSGPPAEPPSELVVVTEAGKVIEVGPQAPTGPAVISLDGTAVLQPGGDTLQVDAIG